MAYKPNHFAPRMEVKAYLLERALATRFSAPPLCLVEKVNAYRNSTHLACLALSLGWSLRSF